MVSLCEVVQLGIAQPGASFSQIRNNRPRYVLAGLGRNKCVDLPYVKHFSMRWILFSNNILLQKYALNMCNTEICPNIPSFMVNSGRKKR